MSGIDDYTKFIGHLNGDITGQHSATFNGGLKVAANRSVVGRDCFWFDGSDDYFRVPTSASFQVGTGDFTLEAWIRTTDPLSDGTAMRIFAQGSVEDNNGDWCFGFGQISGAWGGAGKKMNFAVRSGGDGPALGRQNLSEIVWIARGFR